MAECILPGAVPFWDQFPSSAPSVLGGEGPRQGSCVPHQVHEALPSPPVCLEDAASHCLEPGTLPLPLPPPALTTNQHGPMSWGLFALFCADGSCPSPCSVT